MHQPHHRSWNAVHQALPTRNQLLTLVEAKAVFDLYKLHIELTRVPISNDGYALLPVLVVGRLRPIQVSSTVHRWHYTINTTEAPWIDVHSPDLARAIKYSA